MIWNADHQIRRFGVQAVHRSTYLLSYIRSGPGLPRAHGVEVTLYLCISSGVQSVRFDDLQNIIKFRKLWSADCPI